MREAKQSHDVAVATTKMLTRTGWECSFSLTLASLSVADTTSNVLSATKMESGVAMSVAEKVMRKRRNALRELAK